MCQTPTSNALDVGMRSAGARSQSPHEARQRGAQRVRDAVRHALAEGPWRGVPPG